MVENIETHYSSDDPSSLFDEANIFFMNGMFEEAQQCYKRILQFDAYNTRALRAMGVIAFHAYDIEGAIDYLQRALKIQPDYAAAYCSLGKIQKDLGRLLAARISYQKAYELEPESCEILCELGALHKDLNQHEISKEYLNKALSFNVSSSLAQYQLGCLHQKIKQYDASVDYFTTSIKLQPNYADAYAQLALVHISQGKLHEADGCLKSCLKLWPNSPTIRTIQIFSMNYLPGTTPADIYTVSTDWARLATDNLTCSVAPHHNLPDPEKCLRIGFVSPDFRRHPVGYFVQSFLLLHDREAVEVFCYSDVKGEDELTQTLIESADKWRHIYGVKDDKLAEIIRCDKIDILVDLVGHTKDNRLSTFIMKPAPIQVTWAGYVGTTGLSSIDYLISDRYQSPEDAAKYTVERIVRMPDDYICYTPPEFAPEVASLPALANGYVTFGCFNNLAKVSEDGVALWSEILKSVSGSKFFIKNPSFSDQGTVERYIRLFEDHGISADRIITEGQSPPQEMLERYSCVDIQLDTLPYSGGLTTLESLWMGVPVVTLPGALFSSRHSLTHLMNVGLAECVASSREEYIAIACRLAGDLTKLSEMRRGLRDNMAFSPVCDGFSFTDHLQQMFRNMWYEWCENGIKASNVIWSDGGNEEEFLGDHIEYNEQGNRYSDAGDFDSAFKCYQKALSIKPGYVEAYFNLGLAQHKTGNLEDAVRLFKLVICLTPDFMEAYDNLGNVLIEMGRPDDAQAVFRNAREMKLEGFSVNNLDGAGSITPYMMLDVEVCGRPLEFRCHNNGLSRHMCLDILKGATYPIVDIEDEIRIIVDIGANVGAASLFFKCNYPSATIYAFEPFLASYNLLQHNVRQYNDVQIFNFGLSDSNHDAKLYMSGIDSVTNSIFKTTTESDYVETIQLCDAAQTFKTHGLHHIDILKIDTEGCEVAILTSISDVLKDTKLVYLEYHSEEDRLLIDEILSNTHYLTSARVNMPHRGDFLYVRKTCKNILKSLPLK